MLIDLVRGAAALVPSHPAIVSAERMQSYSQLLARSEAIARGLLERGISRFGLAVEDPIDVAPALAGSSALGAEACVYPRQLSDADLEKLAVRFEHRVIVAEHQRKLHFAEGLTLPELETDGGPLPPLPDLSPLLVLTSGTTGMPKGARHDWTRLVAGIRGREGSAEDRWLLAYNPSQFGGLQVLLRVLASRATLIVPGSWDPAQVIEAMREHAVTHVSATPTFWRLLTGRLHGERDQSLALRQITLGGEAVPDGLIERLRAIFPQAHISQVYASTEAGSVVSVNDGRSGLPLSLLDRDETAAVRLRIVDHELQMKSRVGMLGYYHGDDDQDGWRATGDMVEIRGGRIHFVGRRDEIINVGGVKVPPLPIEEIAGAVDGVEQVAVFARPNALTGQIVAMHVVAEPGVDTEALEQRIRAACAALPRAAWPRRIHFVDALDERGHKLIRNSPQGGP